MLTQYQINKFREQARLKGYTEKQINDVIAIKQQETTQAMQPNQPTQPMSKPLSQPTKPVDQPQSKGIIGGIIDAVTKPAVNFGKFVGEAGAQALRTITNDDLQAFGGNKLGAELDTLMDESDKIYQSLQSTTDANQKKQLQAQLKVVSTKIDDINKRAKDITKQKTTFLEKEENIKTPGKIAETAVRRAAGAAAYVIPGGATLKTAAALGATAGGLSAFSEDNADIGDVASGVKTGAAFGVGGKVAGNIISWIANKKAPQQSILKSIGDQLREDATQVHLKGSVGGAQKEKRIMDTLNELGFSGDPQQKYEQLEPAMNALSTQIKKIIADNPQNIDVLEIEEAFKKSVESQIRTKSLTSKAAQDEIKGYLQDLFKAVDPEFIKGQALLDPANPLPGQVSLEKLFDMKKILNKDYGSIATKLDNGTPLTDRDKIIYYGRKAIDQAITKYLPEVKDLTMMQSYLFDAARPLAAARHTVPTFRIAGTTIPKVRVAEDRLGKFLQDADTTTAELGRKWIDPITGMMKEGFDKVTPAQQEQLIGALTRAGMIASTQDMVNDNEQPGEGDNTDTQNSGQQGNDNEDLQYGSQDNLLDSTIAQNPTAPTVSTHPVFGSKSKQEVLQEAFQKGLNMAQIDEVEKIYDRFAPARTMSSDSDLKAATSLRTEYLQQTKQNGFMDVSNAYRKVTTASQTPAGDVSLIFAYMKMLDPGSVVREGEFATAQNTAGIPERIKTLYNNSLKGDRLSSKQRAEFKSEAGKVYSSYKQTQQQIDNLYSQFAQQYGIDPKLLGIGVIGVQE